MTEPVETATNTSTVSAFNRIVKALKTVSPGKRPALLDLAMREVTDDCPCKGGGVPLPEIPPQASLL